MREYFFFFCFSILSFQVYLAQDKQVHAFVGALSGQNIPAIPLKVSFSLNDRGELKGESNMNFLNQESTVSRILGEYDSRKNLLSFHETKNISTISKADPEDFCYIHVENLKMKLDKEKQLIRGAFVGKYPNGEECASGQLYLVPIAAHEMLDSVFRMDEKSISKMEKSVNVEEPEFETVFGLEDIQIPLDSKTVKLSFYDGYKVDSDIIQISNSRDKSLREIKLTKEKQTVIYENIDRFFSVEVCAKNAGDTPPNTSHLIVETGSKRKYVIHLDKNKCQTITFK